MNYIIYCDDENVENFYVYDIEKHVRKGEKITQNFYCGNLVYRSATYRDKNKLSRKNGCLTSLNKSNIATFLQDDIMIQIPNNNSSKSKYVIAFLDEDGKYCGLKVEFKKIQSYDSKNSKVISSGKMLMHITCQDHEWTKTHSFVNLLDKSIQEKGYYLEIYRSAKSSATLVDYLSSNPATKNSTI